MTPSVSPLLRIENITKTYPGGVVANASIMLDVHAGEIHALLGENGAGKSTLMNILYGLTQPNSGQLHWRGEPVRIAHARDAIRLGIGMVHQHFHLMENFTVLENILLQTPPSWRRPWLDARASRTRLRELCAEFGLPVDPDTRVGNLSLGGRQRVEILKALAARARLLILDEPTSVLAPSEIADLFALLRRFAAGGGAVLLITHKLREVREISARVSVLRAGKLVFTGHTVDTTEEELARQMVGRAMTPETAHARATVVPDTPVALRVENLSVKAGSRREALHDVSFEVRRGEILGIAGVEGNGQQTLFDALNGLCHPSLGRIEMLGEDTTHASPRRLRRLPLGRIPEDRHATGLMLDLSIEDNLILNDYDQPPLSRLGWRRDGNLRQRARELLRRFDIRAAGGPRTTSRALSGGNQQKLILARELHAQPALLIAANPARGLDIGAVEYIHGQLRRQREAGAAILLISSDLDETLALSDRVAVFFRGRVMGIVPAEESQRARIGAMMAG